MIDGVAFGLEIEIIVIPPVKDTDVPMPMTVQELRDFLLKNDTEYSASHMEQKTEKNIRQFAWYSIEKEESRKIAKWMEAKYADYAKDKLGIAGLRVSWDETGKKDRTFDKWQITYDSSVRPMYQETSPELAADFQKRGCGKCRLILLCSTPCHTETFNPKADAGSFVADRLYLDGLEIISPVMKTDFTNDGYSQVKNQLESFYRFLTETCRFALESNANCSTHIHVSCKGAQKWPPEYARRVAVAAYCWQPVVNAMLSEERRQSLYARPWETSKSNEEWIKDVYARKTTAELVMLLNPNDRYWGWNFNNLLLMGQSESYKESKIGTVEFRRPPGSRTLADALKWVHFTTKFVWAATERGTQDYFRNLKGKPTKSELKDFMKIDETLLPQTVIQAGNAGVGIVVPVPMPVQGQQLEVRPTVAENIEEAVEAGAL